MSSSNLVFVKAAQRSKFWQTPEVKGYSHFPETTQSFVPFWDMENHKFKFVGLSDEEVLKLAISCKLSYEDDIHKGKIIEKVDIAHREDAFFNHSRLILKITDDITTFNLNDPLHKLRLATFKAYPFVAVSGDNKRESANAKWLIVDKKQEELAQTNNYVETKEIWEYFTGSKKLSAENIRAIAVAFNDNLKISADTPIEMLEAELESRANDTKTTVNGMTNRARFLMLVKLPKADLKLREFIGNAKTKGVLRQQGQKWFYGGTELATSTENLILYLNDDSNASTLNSIKAEYALALKQNV